MIIGGVAEPPYTAAEVDAAVNALREPERLAHAQEVVTHAAPSLQRVLAESLAAGGWFDQTHEAEVAKAASAEDAQERLRAVRTLVAEETRIGMLVGVAVGFELAHELQSARRNGPPVADTGRQDPNPAIQEEEQ
jgi:hypothetical protein